MEGQTLSGPMSENKDAATPPLPPQPKSVTIREIENGYMISEDTRGIRLNNKQFCAKDFNEAVELLKKIFQTGAG